jgi:hypothetical protein
MTSGAPTRSAASTGLGLSKGGVFLDELDHRAGDVLTRGRFDPFKARGRIDFHHYRSVVGAQNVYAGDVEPHGSDSGFAFSVADSG